MEAAGQKSRLRFVRNLMWLGLILVLLQDPKEERKQFEKKVSQAVSDFEKAYSKGQKIEAIDLLKGLVHERVIAALAKCLADSSEVKRRAIETLAGIDHPKSAEHLARLVKPSQSEKEILTALIKAMDKCRWDIFYAAMGEALGSIPLDQSNSQPISEIVQGAEKIGSMSFVDPLISFLKKFEAFPKDDKNKPFHDLIKRALKACTGEELPDAKAYEDWWKNNRPKAEAIARYIMWCPVTFKRWDRKSTDSKAYCPHHGDKSAATRDQQVIAVKTLK